MKLISALLCCFGIFLSRAFAEEHSEECEFILIANTSTQQFSSPNYPLNYGNHLNCVWIIQAENPNDKVEMIFTTIDTEPCCDFIRIRDGESSASPLLMPISGNSTRTNYFASTNNALHVSFSSDDSITGAGFFVQYRIAPVQGPENCGGNLTATTSLQDVTSPRWPLSYKENNFCLWTITAPEGHLILITFTSYTLETCCDSVVLRDGSDDNSRTIAYLRGRNGGFETYRSTGNSLQIRFRSDGSENFPGFWAFYSSVSPSNTTDNGTVVEPINPECEAELEAPTSGHANFSSPGYPKKHPNDLHCVWIIRAAEGERVRIWFSYIKLEKCCDWIKIRDGESFDSEKLAVISGNPHVFHAYVSTSNTIRVEFDSDETVTSTGFFAYYETYNPTAELETSTCGGKLTATATPQLFSSPNFPNGTYSSGTVCTWTIKSQFGTRVRLNILAIILSSFDTLTVYNGDSKIPSRVVSFTNKHRYKYRITLAGRTAIVQLLSRRSFGHAGFRASYHAIDVKAEEETGAEEAIPK